MIQLESLAARAAQEAGRRTLQEGMQKLANEAVIEYEQQHKTGLRKKHKEVMRSWSKYGIIMFDVIVGIKPNKEKTRVNTFKEMHDVKRSGFILPRAEFDLADTVCGIGSFERASKECKKWGCRISDDKLMDMIVNVGRKCNDKNLPKYCTYAAKKDDILIIMMDGWMVHERGGGWGKKKTTEHTIWHEVKSATIFKLSSIANESKNRNSIIHKHCIAMPPETDPTTFGKIVEREASRMGMLRAKAVYLVMDGGTYLWNIYNDRFVNIAKGTLDFYHASEHLMTLANALYPDDENEAKEWHKNRRDNLKRYGGKNLLSELAKIDYETRKNNSTISRECNYFEGHKEHMNYSQQRKEGLPIGSGAVESLCAQLQQRFKGRGQFWSREHLTYFLKAYTWHMNGELKYALVG